MLSFAKLANGGNLMVRADGRMLFAHTMADGSCHYYVTFRKLQTLNADNGISADEPPEVSDFLVQQCSGWAELHHERVRCRASSKFELLAITGVPVLKRAKGLHAITMVGEAAHVITPFVGTGVNARLQDALQLSQALTDGECTDVFSAMKRYQDAMHTYAADTQCCGFASMMGLREEWAQGLTPEQFVAAASRMRTKLENYRSSRERVHHCTKWVPRAPGLCAMQLMAGDKVGTVGSRFKSMSASTPQLKCATGSKIYI